MVENRDLFLVQKRNIWFFTSWKIGLKASRKWISSLGKKDEEYTSLKILPINPITNPSFRALDPSLKYYIYKLYLQEKQAKKVEQGHITCNAICILERL